MSNFSVSPGAYVKEVDLTTRVQATSTSIGAIVIQSPRGRTDKAYLVTSRNEFLNMFGTPHPKYGTAGYAALKFLEQSQRLWVKRVAKGALHGGVIFSRVPYDDTGERISMLKPMIIGEAEPMKSLKMSDDMVFALVSIGPGDVQLNVLIEPNTKTEDGGFYINIYEGTNNEPSERYLVSLEMRTDGFGSQMFIEQRINMRSTLVRAIANWDYEEGLSDDLVDYGPMVTPRYPNGIHLCSFGGGLDSEPISVENVADVALLTNAWDSFSDPEQMDVNILINGGWTQTAVQLKMDQIAQNRKDCIAVLDVPSNIQHDINLIMSWRRGTNDVALTQINTDMVGANPITAPFDSSYSALYTPDVLVYDEFNAQQIYLPPSGHVAGAYARTDKEKALWFAPAGMDRGSLNVLGVRKVYNHGHREALTEIQVNTIRVIPNHGIKIWGDMTAQSRASILSNVGVRRLMCYLEKSLSISLLYSVFDPTDNILRGTIRAMCEEFLRPLLGARALRKFEVVCDERNNGPADEDAGILNVDVYLTPIGSTKIIKLNCVLTKSGAEFGEMIAANAAAG